MLSLQDDSFRLFRFRGIQVSLHWSWFLVAFFLIYQRQDNYSSIGWNIAEYVALFVIVLLHEFGHSFACRQTGGKADRIVLWPLGGVAFVQPPPRPGAELWSIAAGPLVNVALFPLLMIAVEVSSSMGYSPRDSDFGKFLYMLWWINRGLLIFNLLPIYPLDGGQILRSLLWYGLGRARSLQVAAAIGLAGIPVLAGYALWQSRSNIIFVILMAIYLWQSCLAGFRQGKALRVLERMPRHAVLACPTCRAHPPAGPVWSCASCGHRIDLFAGAGVCPHCQTARAALPCMECGTEHTIAAWRGEARDGREAPPVIDV